MTNHFLSTKPRSFLAPIVAAAIATILFVMQGGTGGVHGTFDGLIGFLMLPSLLLFVVIPLPDSILRHDYLFIIVLPMLVNLALLWLGRYFFALLSGKLKG